MPLRVLVPLIAVVAAAAAAAGAPTTSGAPPGGACDPVQTQPVFRSDVPTAETVLGFELGTREVTAAEADAYVRALDAASDRVTSGTFGTTWQGRPLGYAFVGKPENVSADGLAGVQAAMQRLRDPRTTSRQAADIARRNPVILWVMGNVHGGEESGTDAELRVLYELAAREDCAAAQILDNVVLGIIPSQNPDGREAETRQNFYGFDMNRDWFARTQRETDGKLELLRQYPGLMHIDAHEMGGTHFFFPPAADPIYHEITSETMDWTDNLYGAAMAAEFDRQHIQHWSDKVFDFFAVVYGDVVPSIAFTSAGMTFEKSNFAPISERTYEQYIAHWVSISEGARTRETLLRDWHAAWVEALRQGTAGELEPNEVNDKGSAVTRPVPAERVRHYFIRDEGTKTPEVQSLVRRLQRMDVQVYRLTAPLAVPDYRAYGRPAAPTTLPAGTYWVPMAQTQKHWIQSMLHEDTYVPFRYFYDVSGWSNPLLFNVAGGRSGAVLSPAATQVPALAEPDAAPLPVPTPAVAVWSISGGTSARESTGWLRYLFEQVWRLPYRRITTSEITGGGLSGVDVLVAPNGVAETALNGLGPRGRQALGDWVNSGGRFVGWRGAAEVAARIGLTTALVREPHSDIAGTLIRVRTTTGSPLATGVGPEAWVFYDYDRVITASDPSHVALWYPAAGTEDFFVSGFAEGEAELGGTAAVVDEAVGNGRVIVFASDPNFRAWTVGMQKVLRNAVLGARGAASAAAFGSKARAAKEAAARDAAAKLDSLETPFRVTVTRATVDAARGVLDRLGAVYTIRTAGQKAFILVANPQGLSSEEHSFVRTLPEDLAAAGVEVLAFRGA